VSISQENCSVKGHFLLNLYGVYLKISSPHLRGSRFTFHFVLRGAQKMEIRQIVILDVLADCLLLELSQKMQPTRAFLIESAFMRCLKPFALAPSVSFLC